jgi:hypothetical protein
VWEGSLGPNFFEKAVYEFPVKSNSDLPPRILSEDTIAGEKVGQNTINRLFSADVYRRNGWRPSFLQMPASMGICYYYSSCKYFSHLY